MEKYIWFYVGLNNVLVLGNIIQLQRVIKGRGFLNWIQILIYMAANYWFATLIPRGGNSEFFAITAGLFLVSLGIEIYQFAKKSKRLLDYLFLITSAAPIVLSILLLSGIIL